MPRVSTRALPLQVQLGATLRRHHLLSAITGLLSALRWNRCPRSTGFRNLTAAVTASHVTASLRVTVSCDDVTLETGLSAAQPLRRHWRCGATVASSQGRDGVTLRCVTASLFGREIVKNSKGE
jgi:hypothetical protein